MTLSNPFTHDPRVYKEAKTLVDAGHDVTILAWDKNKQYPKKQMIDGISIVRNYNSKFMNILPFNLLRLPFWWRKTYKDALELFEKKHINTVHCHDLDSLRIGFRLKKKKGCKLIYDSHEIWPYMIEGEIPDFIVKLLLLMERKMIKSVDRIITVGKSSKDYFKKISDNPIDIIMNCKNLIYNDYQVNNNSDFTLIYIGSMSKKRFFPDIVDVVGNIKKTSLVLASANTGEIYELIKKRCKLYENTQFLGKIPEEELLPRTRSADATFILVDPSNKHYRHTLFNKQFEAMVCGRPIIVTNNTYAAEMTKELDCGLTVDYNQESIRENIIKLRDNPDLCKRLGLNAFRNAQVKYNWNSEKEKLLKIYERVDNG
jgi:glycosyltransferase involved in cell wall biosynthesis